MKNSKRKRKKQKKKENEKIAPSDGKSKRSDLLGNTNKKLDFLIKAYAVINILNDLFGFW